MNKFLLKFPVFILALLFTAVIAIYFFLPNTVQQTRNLEKSHTAKLVRNDGIDVNFKVIVDGEAVFYSPDFAPVKDDFRERLIWNEKNNVIVLEVAGKRLFGYDVVQKRKLSDEELMEVEYTPFSKYEYEGKLPEENQ